jgi:glutamyl-tRNA reductase
MGFYCNFAAMLDNLFVVGFNFHKNDASQRGLFSLNESQQLAYFEEARLHPNIHSITILNTCNRTEIYGCGDLDLSLQIYKKVLGITHIDDAKILILKGTDAIEHVFKVASGLDSQVVGDLEILGQFKYAFQFSKTHKLLNGYMERLANNAIQASKVIKSQTQISSGTVSLSYAAVKYIKNHITANPCNILIIGTGNFGKRIALNVRDYLPKAQITLCNRTRIKAEELANSLNCKVYEFDRLTEALENADVIISSVNDTGGPLIRLSQLDGVSSEKLFVDMSIPLSIDKEIASHPLCHLITIDEVSEEINTTLASRQKDLPRAQEIVKEYVTDFQKWSMIFEKSDSIREWKNILKNVSDSCPIMSDLSVSEKNKFISEKMAHFTHYLRYRDDLPSDTEKIIAHFIQESDKALDCHKSCLHYQTNNCDACPSL